MTIKIIELMNKIANYEEVPKVLKFMCYVWTYDDKYEDYKNEENNWLLQGNICTIDNIKDFLNLKLEIIEDKTEKLKKLKVLSWNECIHDVTSKEKQIMISIQELQLHFNNLIDKINEL